MKSCPGCKTMVSDDFYGDCSYCGRGLGDTKSQNQSPNFHLSQMQRQTLANDAFGQQNELSPTNAPESVVEIAKSFFPLEEAEEHNAND